MKSGRTRVTAMVALGVLASACLCRDSEQYRLSSPKGTRTVVVSVRNCGATTGFTTIIGERRGWFGGKMDLVMIGGEAVGEKQLRINWAGEDEIVIAVDPSLSVTPLPEFPGGLKVGYEPGTRLGS